MQKAMLSLRIQDMIQRQDYAIAELLDQYRSLKNLDKAEKLFLIFFDGIEKSFGRSCGDSTLQKLLAEQKTNGAEARGTRRLYFLREYYESRYSPYGLKNAEYPSIMADLARVEDAAGNYRKEAKERTDYDLEGFIRDFTP